MKYWSILFCILFTTVVYSQPKYDSTRVSPLIRKLALQIDTITKSNCFKKFSCYYSKELKLLRERVKVFELVQLVNHPSEHVRISAFDGLLDSAYPKFVDIIEQHLNDTAFLYLWEADFMVSTNVIEKMLSLIMYNNSWVGKFDFTEADFKRLAALEEQYWDKKNGWDDQKIALARKKFGDSLSQPNGHVNDYEKIFDRLEEIRLDSLIKEFKKRTSIQITLITFGKTNISSDSLDALTQRIAEEWMIGQTYNNNGIVIGISRTHKRISILMGNAIEKMLSKQEKQQLIDDEFLKAGAYFKTTFNALKTLILILEERNK